MIAFNNFKNQISNDFTSGDWIFRGQSSTEWGLETSYYRFCNQSGLDYSIPQFEKMLEEFILTGSNLIGVDLTDLDFLKQIALAQHHGLPTPFLDWTFSPYIALYFAISDCLLTLTNKETAVRVWAIKIKEEHLIDISSENTSLLEIRFGILKGNILNTKRVGRQLGCFSYHGSAGDLAQCAIEYNLDLRFFDVVVDKFRVLSELQLMGINSGILFDDLNGIANDTKLSILTKNSGKLK